MVIYLRIIFAMSVVFILVINSQAQTTKSAFQNPISNRLAVRDLDTESQQCVRCHDGSIGREVELRPAGAPIEYETGRIIHTKNHSLGMSYRTAFLFNPTEYKYPEDINSKIKFIDGKVGCLSCHIKVESIVASLVSIDENESHSCTVDQRATRNAFQGRVCLECHRK